MGPGCSGRDFLCCLSQCENLRREGRKGGCQAGRKGLALEKRWKTCWRAGQGHCGARWSGEGEERPERRSGVRKGKWNCVRAGVHGECA